MSPAILYLSLFIFIAVCVFTIRAAKAQWGKLYNPFPIPSKIPWTQHSNGTVAIDKRIFKTVVIVVTPEGLLLGQYGLLPRLFIPGQILIPWRAVEKAYTIDKKIWGVTITNCFLDIQTQGGIVQLMLPNEFFKQIGEKNYLLPKAR